MAADFARPVVRVEVWQRPQPTMLNRFAPFVVEAAVGPGAGGADSRMKAAKFTRSDDISASVPIGLPSEVSIFVLSSGVPLYTQSGVAARSLVKASLETPC